MVLGAKKTLQSIPSKGRISVMKIQNFTVERRHTVLKAAYGSLLIVISIIMAAINPVSLVTNWYLDMKEGSFLYKMWEAPPYELYSEVWVYNYTNVQEFLDGTDTKLKLKEVGPFKFQEIRVNENMTIDKERGILKINPKITLKFMREESVGDLKDISVYVPNIALIAISTLTADRLGYIANAGVYYSMSAIGSKLFSKLTIQELFWGYNDPLVSIANTLVPGWIDFGKLGLLDRFYAVRPEKAEVELKDPATKYSIKTWNDIQGLPEQGYKTFNTSTPCNRVSGVYEGLMITPNYPKGKEIPIFRKQACRSYPFTYEDEITNEDGINVYRYNLATNAFSKKSKYACNCTEHCLPDGFVDVSKCYYGFPISLSKPHFMDVDPSQMSNFEGMHPDPVKHASYLEVEPTIGVPLKLKSNIQVNLAVRSAAGNPITKPLKDKVIPLAWLSLFCNGPPPEIISLLRLRFIIAPPLVITTTVLLFVAGVVLTLQGLYQIWKPKYKLIHSDPATRKMTKQRRISVENKISMQRKRSMERRTSNVILNMAVDNIMFRNDDDLAKEAVSLLAIAEDDNDDLPDLVFSD